MADFPSNAELIATPGTMGSNGQSTEDDARAVLDVVDALRDEFKDRDAQLADIEKVVFLENAVDIPSGYQKTALEVRSPYPNHIISTITSALSVNPPYVSFDPVGIGDQAQENQILRQHFFDASWERQQQEARRPLFRQFCHAVVAYGEGIIKTTERKKRVWSQYGSYSKKLRADLDQDEHLDADSKDRIYDGKTEEFKRGAGYPIASTDVPPATFYYLKNEDGLTCVAEVKEIPYLDAVQRFSIGTDKNGTILPEATGLPISDAYKALGDRTTVEVIEIWDYQKVQYLVRGHPQKERKNGNRGLVVKTLKHGYGDKDLKVLRGPYFHSMGITTSSRELYKQSQGVLFAFLRLFPLLDRLLTIRGQAAVTYGFGAFKRARGSSSQLSDSAFGVSADEQSAHDEEIRPGYVYPDDIEPINMPSGGPDIDKAIADVRAMIELALPSVAQGVVGGESGYAINQAAHLSRLAWNPIIANIEQTLSERVSFESWLIENRIKEQVWVYGSLPDEIGPRRRRRRADEGWLGIDADDLAGLHRYRVHLKPETPSNQVIEIRMHNDMLRMQVESRQQAIEALGGNPIEVERQLMFEALKADPAIQNMVKQGVFQQLATLQQQAMQGVDAAPPGTGGPAAPPPPDAQQGMAPPSQEQLAMLAAMGNGQGGAVPPGVGMEVQQPPIMPGAPGIPGTPSGAPGGSRNYPQGHQPLPGAG